MASFVQFNQFVEDLAHGVHNFSTDTLKVALSNVAPSLANAVLADITQIADGNGYVTGGQAVTITDSGQTGGTYTLVIEDEVFTASGAGMADFRYVILYNDTPTSPADPLIGYYDIGSTVQLASTETLTIEFSLSSGVIVLEAA